VTETARFDADLATGPWDNPLVSRTQIAQDVVLRCRVGRLDTCLTDQISEDDLTRMATRPPADPQKALLFDWPRDQSVRAYRFQWNDARIVQSARAELLPDPPKSPLSKGWSRFLSDSTTVDVAALGRFYWLDYPSRPRDAAHTVALWSPNLSNPTPLETLDFNVFFTPSTYKYVARHPFGLVPNTKPADQQYMSLGGKYLLDEYFFVHQLLARRNRSILVAPICNQGDWGPFQSGEGIYRLLREAALFLHRQCRTSLTGVKPPTSNGLAGPNLRHSGLLSKSTAFGSVPSVGRVVIGGFSAGIDPVKKILAPARYGWSVNRTAQYWGAPPSNLGSAEEAWQRAWTELWDLDGNHPGPGAWSNYLKRLGEWYAEQPDRRVRLYHSSGLRDATTDNHVFYKQLLSGERNPLSRTMPASAGMGAASILQGARWTVVRLDDAYIDGGPATETPPFSDAHHTTPKIGFSHATGLTQVGK
jgi:hypothetical protein